MPLTPIFWNWLILACVFLGIEAFTASFFFIFWAMAAFALTILTWLVPHLSVQLQALSFALLSVGAISIWWLIARNWQKKPQDEASLLNNRGRNLLGQQLVLQMPIAQGSGRVQIDDGAWTVRGEDMPAGTMVVVVNVDSTVLDVVRVS